MSVEKSQARTGRYHAVKEHLEKFYENKPFVIKDLVSSLSNVITVWVENKEVAEKSVASELTAIVKDLRIDVIDSVPNASGKGRRANLFKFTGQLIMPAR